MKVLVFLEQRQAQLKASALEALTVAASLSGGQAQKVAAVVIGHKVKGLAQSLKGYGADTVYIADSEAFQYYQGMHYCQALQQAVEAFKPDALLAMASPMGRDLFPRLAARLDAGLITDLIELSEGADFTGGVKPMFAGKVLATVTFAGKGLKMATLRPNVFASRPAANGQATVVELAVQLPASASLQALEVRQGQGSRADLTEANRIISGGRALGSADNFKVLYDCAEVLQASVGASRAAVDAGYASHDMQVGQTGKTVNPSLYIACGLSGSIQHMAGMRTSKVIVAINTDPEAPIFSIADYGIVGDLFEAVPLLRKHLKALLTE